MNSDFLADDRSGEGAGVVPVPDAFAYFVDPAELALLTAGWPSEMRLVLCMDSGGLCEFVVFHDEEEGVILDRIVEILDRPAASIAVSPEVADFPTRSLLFSEENALLKAVQESESLHEIAADYLINYNFACEEGLDLDKFMRPRMRPKEELALRVTADKIFPMRSKSSSQRRKARSGMPEGYVPVDEVVPDECFYLGLEMWRTGERIRIAAASARPLQMVPTLVREIAFRDDFSSIYIPRKFLPGQWRPKDGLVLDIPGELFPSGFAENCGHRKVRLAVMPRGLFVEFGQPVAPSEPAAQTDDLAPSIQQTQSRRGRFLSNIHLPLLALAGLGAAGLFSTIVAQTTATNGIAEAHATPSYASASEASP